jgi:acetoin utilization protein AcuB
MIVGMWMSRHLIVAPPDMRVTEAARLMKENRIRRLPVARSSEDLHLLGIVSVTDIYRSLPPGSNLFSSLDPAPESPLHVREIMTAEVLTTTPDTPIEDAATIMRDRKIGALPVVRAGQLVGLVTESDIFRAFISVLRADPGATRVTFQVAAGEDVFELLAKRKRDLNINVLSLMSSQREDRLVCVVRLSGPDVQLAIDDLWKSGHHVINVLHC